MSPHRWNIQIFALIKLSLCLQYIHSNPFTGLCLHGTLGLGIKPWMKPHSRDSTTASSSTHYDYPTTYNIKLNHPSASISSEGRYSRLVNGYRSSVNLNPHPYALRRETHATYGKSPDPATVDLILQLLSDRRKLLEMIRKFRNEQNYYKRNSTTTIPPDNYYIDEGDKQKTYHYHSQDDFEEKLKPPDDVGSIVNPPHNTHLDLPLPIPESYHSNSKHSSSPSPHVNYHDQDEHEEPHFQPPPHPHFHHPHQQSEFIPQPRPNPLWINPLLQVVPILVIGKRIPKRPRRPGIFGPPRPRPPPPRPFPPPPPPPTRFNSPPPWNIKHDDHQLYTYGSPPSQAHVSFRNTFSSPYSNNGYWRPPPEHNPDFIGKIILPKPSPPPYWQYGSVDEGTNHQDPNQAMEDSDQAVDDPNSPQVDTAPIIQDFSESDNSPVVAEEKEIENEPGVRTDTFSFPEENETTMTRTIAQNDYSYPSDNLVGIQSEDTKTSNVYPETINNERTTFTDRRDEDANSIWVEGKKIILPQFKPVKLKI